MHFFGDYGLFLAKVATIVVGFLVVISFIIAFASRGKEGKDKLKIKKINKKYHDFKDTLQHAILTKSEYKRQAKIEKRAQKKHNSKVTSDCKKIFVINFHGDIRATETSSLREEVTAILMVATPKDEVLVCLDSGGGIVPNYGLAASQLKRLRDHNIPLTVAVDKIAASGGYMMACVANQILAAPCAIVGSIGVVAQIPNFHRLLKSNDIDFEQITAGEYKRTLSMFGENTEKGREKVQEDVDSIHRIFKEFIVEHRPQVDINKVATGEHWHAVQALQLQLIDRLITSDDYLLTASKNADVYEVHYAPKKSLMSRLSLSLQQASDKIITKASHKYSQLFL
jgi:serine protease SohB